MLIANNVVLALTVVGTSVAIAVECLAVGELITNNDLEDTLVKSKTDLP